MLAIMVIGFIVFIVLSALCSGSETGVYKISKVNLRINAEHGGKLSIILRNMLEDTNGVIFSILIANNVFNYSATTIATYLFATYYENSGEYYAALVTTPLLFVFGEVIPKNLFFLRANTLMAFVTLPLWVIHRLLCVLKITPVMKLMANVMSKLFKMPTSGRSYTNIRSTINIISDETRHEGLLSHVQWDIMNRMTGISNTTIASVMVPVDYVVMVSVTTTKEELRDILRKHPYTRILVYKNNKQDIIGYLNLYKALNSSYEDFNITELTKELKELPAQMPVIDAIKEMNHKNLRMALVSHKRQKIGIITIKDLAEELTGELSVC
ncbi:MAG: CNNM domain-containing protein [Sedimentisphaeraceae bacterium JB056]